MSIWFNWSFDGANFKLHCPKPSHEKKEIKKYSFFTIDQLKYLLLFFRRQQMDNTLHFDITLVVVTCSSGAIMCLCRLRTKCIKNYWTTFFLRRKHVLFSVFSSVETIWRMIWGDGWVQLVNVACQSNIGFDWGKLRDKNSFSSFYCCWEVFGKKSSNWWTTGELFSIIVDEGRKSIKSNPILLHLRLLFNQISSIKNLPMCLSYAKLLIDIVLFYSQVSSSIQRLSSNISRPISPRPPSCHSPNQTKLEQKSVFRQINKTMRKISRSNNNRKASNIH